jgi:hypothetical protein
MMMAAIILHISMPAAGKMVIAADPPSPIAADPPNPELPGTFSCKLNLTQYIDPSGPSGMTFDSHGSGSIQMDAAGRGKSRIHLNLTTVTTLPAGTSVSVISNITDYVAGASWQQMCTSAAGGPMVCNCVHSKVTGHLADESQNTSGWSYVGDATIAGEPCTEWLASTPGTGPATPDVTANYFVTKAHPPVLRKSLGNFTGNTMEETMNGYVLGPPPPSTWAPPPEWKCPTVPELVPAAAGQPPSRFQTTLHVQLAQMAVIAQQIGNPK